MQKFIDEELREFGDAVFDYAAEFEHKFYTGADIENLVREALSELYQEGYLEPVGRELFQALYGYARDQGARYLTVKTVEMGRYEDYDQTNRFYQALGFVELECLPGLWDEANPCQIYIMDVR